LRKQLLGYRGFVVPGTVAPDRVLRERYRLTREIAQGGMATVWEARDAVLDRPVAVKVLHAHLAADQDFVARFRREAVAAAGLAHPNVVTTYDTGCEAGVDFIVMEFVDGPTLRHILDARPNLSPSAAVEIAAQVADALTYAHGRGIVHRDVKPGNILIRGDGQVKVTDFGIAKADDGSELTRTGAILGTVEYLAPEQVEGRTVDARSDVYALGIVLYEMLTGEAPFPVTTELATATARLLSDPPAPSALRRELTPAIDAVVGRALARDPDERFASAADFATALRALGLETTDATPIVTLGGEPTRPPARRTTRPAVALTLVGGIAVGLAVLLVVGRAKVPLLGSSPARATTTVHVASATDFDPGGKDRAEHPEQTKFAIDGNPKTAWNTERYVSRDFGVKPGVGLVLTLDAATKIHGVEIDTASGDWTGTIYVADRPATDLAAWGTPAASITATTTHTVVPLDHPVTGRYVLVWVTNLPPERFLAVDEVRVAG
jgi:serine/threonine-protein kinase